MEKPVVCCLRRNMSDIITMLDLIYILGSFSGMSEEEIDKDIIVSALENQPEFIEDRPADCVCSDQAFSAYGCMCRIRRMP
jgi:hypothetical protein